MECESNVGGKPEGMQVVGIYNFDEIHDFSYGEDKPKNIIRTNWDLLVLACLKV